MFNLYSVSDSGASGSVLHFFRGRGRKKVRTDPDDPLSLTHYAASTFGIANRLPEWRIGKWQPKKECFVLNGNCSMSWACFRASASKSRNISRFSLPLHNLCIGTG